MTVTSFGDYGVATDREPASIRLEMALATATVALAPMNYFRLEWLYFTAADLCGLATLLVMLVNRRIDLRFYGPATPLWLISCVLFLGGLVLGAVVNGDPMAGLVVFVQYLYSLLVIPIVVAGRRLDQTLFLIKVFVVSVAVVMLHGAYLVHLADNPDTRLLSPSGRLRSLIERENAAGAIAAIAITFSIFLYVEGRLRLGAFLALLGILFYGVLLTGSNSATAAAFIGAVLFLLFSGRVRILLVALPVLAAGGALLLRFGEDLLPEVFRRRVFQALASGDIEQAGTFSDRFLLLKEALGIADGTAFLGLGADQYQELSEFGAPVHNTYLLVLSEGGILSLLGLFGLLLTGIYLGARMLADRAAVSRAALTLATIIFFALLINVFAHVYARFWHVPLALALSLSLRRGDQFR
ncbi:O-antigen ligase family protein [Jannaschia ovalis]|uniref:O-antigen ligase family protein n=1 Tax=Jannaschia ovalis TaxID=3038773 RepID=A0ABY8LBK8_9RHOB|nr:O-antigen ligase family protein [Jannaschia sp. GRR-S6-38]WGH78714.1 O-antigen ligase family protein [Jannaschia sp. GRR-S6-38]